MFETVKKNNQPISTDMAVYFEKVARHLLAAGFSFEEASATLNTFDAWLRKAIETKPPKVAADQLLGA